jgi:hypothetical protein
MRYHGFVAAGGIHQPLRQLQFSIPTAGWQMRNFETTPAIVLTYPANQQKPCLPRRFHRIDIAPKVAAE